MPIESQLKDMEALRTRIGWRIDVELLPLVLPGATRAAHGSGSKCGACDQVIERDQIEYQVDLESGSAMTLHMSCYVVWQIECLARIRKNPRRDLFEPHGRSAQHDGDQQ